MVRATGTSPAPLKADGSSHSSGKFKLGGTRPARMGGLEATERGPGVCMQGSPLGRAGALCPLPSQAQPGLPEDPLSLSKAQAASGVASPAHPSVAPWPNPRHCCPPVWNTGNRRNRPSLHASGGSCCPHWPEPPSLPRTRARGGGGGGPSPVCMHLCREHCGQETQPVGP